MEKDQVLGGVMCGTCEHPLECEECEKMGIPMYCTIECAHAGGAGMAKVCHHNQD